MILKLIEDKSTQSLMAFIAIRIAIVLSCWGLVILGSFIDFWSGTSTARALGEKLCSKGFRKTMTKDIEYLRILLFMLLFDTMGICFLHFYTLPYASILCSVAVLIIEAKSVIENSRRKKSQAAKVPEIIKKLVNAQTATKVQDLLKILDYDIEEIKRTRNSGECIHPPTE